MRSATKSSYRVITSNSIRAFSSRSINDTKSNSGSNADSEFSSLYKAFADELKGIKNPSFTEMSNAFANSVHLKESLKKFFDNSSSVTPDLSLPPARIAVTGAAGAIGYSLLFRLAAGELLGRNTPIVLSCLEIGKGLNAMEGVKMELKDCAFPLLSDVIVTDDPEKAFENADYIFLVGAFPRSKGMDRAELLQKNAGIFSVQGKAINKTSNKSKVKTLIVGNPANTNCLIASRNAPDISPTQFSAMTRLDHNRGISQLADKTKAAVSDITKFAIWGNHSDTQFPDISNTLINGKEARSVISDDKWVNETFIPTVAKRGAAIIAARGVSSAASAANAAIDQMRDWTAGSKGEWVSMGVWSGEKESDVEYREDGVGNGLFFSYPVICKNGGYEIVKGLKMDDAGRNRMKATNEELVQERSAAGLDK